MLLRQAGQLAWLQTDYPAARSLLEQSLALYRELGNTEDLPAPLNALGEVARTQGDYPTARQYFEESLALLRARGDKANIAWALQALGEVAQEQGDAAARPLAEESLALFHEVGDRRGVSLRLERFGRGGTSPGGPPGGADAARGEPGDPARAGAQGRDRPLLGHLGELAVSQHEYQDAASLYCESLALRRDLGDRRSIATCIERLAGLAASAAGPSLERAARLFGAAEALRESLGAPLSPAERGEYQRLVDLTRAGMETAAFAAAWAEGRALSLEDVIACALGNSAPQ